MGRLLSSRPVQTAAPAAAAPLQQPVAPLRARGNTWSPPTFSKPAPVSAGPVQAVQGESSQKFALYCALAMVFLRIAVLPEMISFLAHTNTYLLYLITPPAVIGLMAAGGLGRSLRYTPVWCWLGMFLCMSAAAPVSSWAGGSVSLITDYLKVQLICIFILAGTVINWEDLKKTVTVMGVAGVVVLAFVRVAAITGDDGRLTFPKEFASTIANPNDMAAHVILTLPFIFYVATQKGRNPLIRYPMFGAMAYGLWVIVGTASRGAMIGVAIICVILFMRGRSGHKLALAVGLPSLLVAIVVIAPDRALMRLATFFVSEKTTVSAEADESLASRTYLLQQSIKFTLQHPVFGVGPGQFATFEGMLMKGQGKNGNWHETHNSYTQMSSECGLPALIFMLLGLGGAIKLVNKSYRAAKAQKNEEVAEICTFYLATMIAYCVTLTFLACAYRFTLPTMVSLGVAVHAASQRKLGLDRPAQLPVARA